MKINVITLFILTFSLIFSCHTEPKNYVEFSGKVAKLPADVDSIMVYVPNGYQKKISIGKNGVFKDTLHIKEGMYRFKIGDEYGNIYLKNADKIHLNSRYDDFDQQLKFSGNGSSVTKSKVETEKLHLLLNFTHEDNLSLSEGEFNQKVKKLRDSYAALKQKHNSLEASYWKDADTEVEETITAFSDYREHKLEIANKFTGKASPGFTYESIDGNNVSLRDFAGKYVYLDIWATWCGPCRREIPALKALEKEYHDKNIAFISISIDKLADKSKWQKFVQEEQLTGVQLFADNDWESDFVKAYEIKGIPRFILLDPKGNIINPDAPRPSSKELKKLFNELGI